MNQNLSEVLKLYSIGHGDFCARLEEYSKPALIGLFADLLTLYFNDRNSSTLREFLTAALAGYEHSSAKIGYNGFKTTAAGEIINCEVKPKNVRSADFEDYKEGKRKSAPARLNGGGNFTDYTWGHFEKDRANNPNMLVSGFVDGRLLYILEFPFSTKIFLSKLEKQLQKRFPDGDIESEYLRGANFDYRDYIKDAQMCYLSDDMESFSPYIQKRFFEALPRKREGGKG